MRGLMLAVVLGILGAAAGSVLGLQRADSRVATATILVDPLEGNPFFPSGAGGDLLNLETEAQLVASDPVASLVAEKLGSSASRGELLSGLSVSVRPNTQILDVEYTARRASVAVERAQAFAEVFLAFRKSRAEASRFDNRTAIEDKLEVETQELSRLVKERVNAPAGSGEAALLSEQITSRTSYIGELRTQLAQYEGGTTDPGQIVTPAVAESPSVLTSPLMLAALGGLVGAGAGFAVSALGTRSRGRLRSTHALDALGVPVLGSVTDHEVQTVRETLATQRSLPELGPGLKKLRVSVLTKEKRRPVSILVGGGNGSSDTASGTGLGLAAAIALSHQDVIVVDSTGDAHGLSSTLDLAGAEGLTELLVGTVGVDDALVQLAPNLMFVPAGGIRGDVDDLFTNPQMGLLVAELKKRSDVVVLLTHALAEPAGEALAHVVDTVVVEARQGVDRIRELADLEETDGFGGLLLGVVFVGRHRRTRVRGADA